MRKILLLISGVLICNIIFSQEKTKEYFLEKSKKQKTVAWVLLGTGATAIITGILIEAPHRGTGDSQSFTGGAIEVGGIICTLTSIPFFISSSKNKKRAAALAISNRPLLQPVENTFKIRAQPTISLTISFK